MLGNHISDNGILKPNISAIEVSLVSNQGFWLLADDEELYLTYTDFPWFKDATIAQITHVERPSANHLYWPSLDIDLSIASVRDPGQYPLVSKIKA